jgi:hypothetical protein
MMDVVIRCVVDGVNVEWVLTRKRMQSRKRVLLIAPDTCRSSCPLSPPTWH